MLRVRHAMEADIVKVPLSRDVLVLDADGERRVFRCGGYEWILKHLQFKNIVRLSQFTSEADVLCLDFLNPEKRSILLILSGAMLDQGEIDAFCENLIKIKQANPRVELGLTVLLQDHFNAGEFNHVLNAKINQSSSAPDGGICHVTCTSIHWVIQPTSFKSSSSLFSFIIPASCDAPTLSRLGLFSKFQSIEEADVETDFPLQYKSELKKCAILLNDACTQLKFNVKDNIYSFGFGSKLLGNTILTSLIDDKEEEEKLFSLREDAVLILMDRSYDWYTVNETDLSLSTFIKLHNQLITHGNVDEILKNITEALNKSIIKPKQAVGLAIRAASLMGKSNFQPSMGVRNDFQFALANLDSSLYNSFAAIQESSSLLFNEQKKAAPNDACAFKQCDQDESVALFLLNQLLKEKKIPAGLKKCSSAMDEVVTNGFSLFQKLITYSDASSKNNSIGMVEKIASCGNLLLFFLGGVSENDLAQIDRFVSIHQENQKVFVGATHVLNGGVLDCFNGMHSYTIKRL